MPRKRARVKKFNEPFAGLERSLLESTAYRELSPNAAKVYPLMRLQAGMNAHHGKKDFAFTYRDAHIRGFARATFSRSLRDLVAKGFINPTGFGGLRGFCKEENHFSLSERWRDYGTDKFEEIPRYDEWKI